MTKEPEWKQFEQAVVKFLQTLDKNAKITHDARIPDKQTGGLRQRDIWIEAKICELFPIKIYVSCKFTGKNINGQDMDAVIGELQSSGANKGVIYSKTGFTPNAIKKAKFVDICCCKLYDNQPPDLPEVLLVKKSYCIRSVIHFNVDKIETTNRFKNYNQIFNLRVKDANGKDNTLLDEVCAHYGSLEKYALKKENLIDMLPQNLEISLELKTADKEERITVKIAIGWKIYEAKLEAFLTNGSYSFTDKKFIGNQISPSIDLQNSHPGDGWNLLLERPKISGNTAVLTQLGDDYKKALVKHFGLKEIKK